MDLIFTVGIVALVSVCVYLLIALQGNAKKYANMPPSPPTWPLLGNLPFIYFSNKRLDVLAKEFSQKNGGIITLWLGPVPLVVIGDEALCRDAFVNHASLFSNRLASKIVHFVTSSCKGIVFSPQCKQLVLKRKWSHQVLKTLLVEEVPGKGDTIKQECKGLVKRLAVHDGKAIDVKEEIFKTIIRITSTACFGQKFADNNDNIKDVKLMLDYAFGGGSPELLLLLSVFPSLIHVPLFRLNYLKKYKQIIDKLMQQEMDRHAASENKEMSRDMVDCFAESCDTSDPDDAKKAFFHDKDERARIVGDLFVAGSEAVSVSLLWCILVLTKLPKFQHQTRDEIERVSSSKGGIESSVMTDFPYTRAFISEVFRFITIAPFPVLHLSAANASFHGYDLPRETALMPDIYALHHDEKVWENPSEFRPERFLKEDGSYFIPNKNYIPFGIGPRVCIGEMVAKKEVLFALVYLLLSFNMMPGKEGLPDFDESVMLGTVLHPVEFKVVLQRRKSVDGLI